jgi:hypothetical protein
MKLRLTFLALGTLLLAGSVAQAQQRQGPTPQEMREMARARREAMRQNPDAIRQRREAMRQRLENMPPEQRAFLEALRAERASIRDQVKAGTLDRQAARETMRAWIQANRPARPGQ